MLVAIACGLIGAGFNTASDFWWTAPVAALVIPIFLLREAQRPARARNDTTDPGLRIGPRCP